MTNADPPKDGDFAAYLERKSRAASNPGRGGQPEGARVGPQDPWEPFREARRQTIDDVLAEGEEPTEDFLEEFRAMEGVAPVSDEELELQALQHPGEDMDPSTPE